MKLSVILGSTRVGRKGERVGKWVMSQMPKFKKFDAELLDLRDYPLPFFDEVTSPDSLDGKYSTPVAKKWAKKIDSSDAFIIITPEYNHGPPAVLKNALDYVYNEWNRKPVTFVSYASGAAAGVRAVEQLRCITSELAMAPMQAAVHIGHAADTFDEAGMPLKGHFNERLAVVVEQLLWWSKALKAAR